MFYVVLTICVIHLVLLAALTYGKARVATRVEAALAPLLLLFFCPGFITVEPIVLAVLVGICHWAAPQRPGVFVGWSVIAVIAIFSGTAIWTLQLEQELLAKYPMESMHERVPPPKIRQPAAVSSRATSWTHFESSLEVERDRGDWARAGKLRRLHEQTTDSFVNSPGFGVVRAPMGPLDSRGYDVYLDKTHPVEQPMNPAPQFLSSDVLEAPFTGKIDDLDKLHFGGLMDFVNFRGFGYIKDRQHVAGFRSHRFSDVPSAQTIKVKRIELVSLVMHERPAVYVSDELPNMEKLRNSKTVPTRGLSDFEARGLLALQSGEDLFVREAPGAFLMLGAIRSVKLCVDCHGGQTGDLLGAFSYQLERVESK